MQAEKLRAFIVDDEPIARQLLVDELSGMPDIAIVGEAGDGLNAVQGIMTLRPALLFLDVQMPGCDGFSVLAAIQGPLPRAVIFVTAYEQHALRAFERDAADYLLKPVRPERLRQALDRARTLCRHPGESAEKVAQAMNSMVNEARGTPSKVVGRKGQDYYLLEISSVDLFRADGEIVWIFAGEKKYMATTTLRELERRLQGTSFRRIHRSALVNADRVRRITSLSSQRWLLKLANGLEVVASKRLGTAVRELIRG